MAVLPWHTIGVPCPARRETHVSARKKDGTEIRPFTIEISEDELDALAAVLRSSVLGKRFSVTAAA